MAITKVSALTEITSTTGSEELLINDGGTSKKIQVSNLPDTDTNTNQLTTFTVSATTDTNATTISQGDDLMFTAGTGITCETTADGTVTITNTVTDTDTVYTHPNHSGEVTSTGDGSTVVAHNVVDEANLKVSNAPTNGYVLTAQSGASGGLTWAADTNTDTKWDGGTTGLTAATGRTSLGLVIGTDVQGYDADTAKTDTAQEWTSQQNFNATTLTFDATQDWNLSANQVCKLTLTANTTFDAPTNQVDGSVYVITIIQDGTGSRTAGWNTVFKWAGGTAPTLTTDASAKDVFTFVSDGTNMNNVAQVLDVS